MPETPLFGRLAIGAALALAMAIPVPRGCLAQLPDSAPSKPDSVNPRAVMPERPTVATHAYTVAPGYIEIEAGVQDARPANISQFVAPVVVKIGLLPRLQLEVETGYVRNSAAGATASGAMDTGFALKQRLMDAIPVLHDFSVQGTVKFPTGAPDVTTKTTDASLLLISSRPIGAGELDLNAGYTRRSGDGKVAPVDATLLTASFGTPLRGAVGAVAEVFSMPATTGPSGTPTSVGFLFGPTYQVRPWLVLDAGGVLNVRNMMGNSVYTGLTYNVGRIPGVR